MSDTFDHEGDAWDSLNDSFEGRYGDDAAYDKAPFIGNPLDNHSFICELKDVIQATQLAYRVKIHQVEVWIPKKLCKISAHKIYLWNPMFRTKVKEVTERAFGKSRPKPNQPWRPDAKQTTVDDRSLNEHLRWHDRELGDNDFNFVPDRE